MTGIDGVSGLLREALDSAQQQRLLPDTEVDDPYVERPQDAAHGDYASSLPLKLARPMRMNPMAIAEALVSAMPQDEAIGSVSASRPGFVNFFLDPAWLAEQVEVIRTAGETYGSVDVGSGQRVQVEFVSVNPNGPIHVGHGRGAVYGSALANVLEAAGYDVEREYYVNDGGNQMNLFYRSLRARYMQVLGHPAEVPDDGYQGEYMVALAREIESEEGDRFVSVPEEQSVAEIGQIGLGKMIEWIRRDLRQLRVEYDVWFSERSLYEDGHFQTAMTLLHDKGYVADREGATWFVSTELGDEKDKVLVRSTGAPTYFAGDVAYHYNKLVARGFDRVIDIWGADHQGNVPFMKAMLKAFEIPQDRLDLLLYQLVSLKRGDEVMRLSTRSGNLIPLKELVDEVGADACRYIFLSRSPESQMEFDLDLAKRQSSENPVHYVQYAHARIAGIFRTAAERGIEFADGDLSLLRHEAELALVRKMLVLPDLVEAMARTLTPHQLPHYTYELATALQQFYEQCRVVSSEPDDLPLTKARLKLVEAARIVLARCLGLMLMDAPDRM